MHQYAVQHTADAACGAVVVLCGAVVVCGGVPRCVVVWCGCFTPS